MTDRMDDADDRDMLEGFFAAARSDAPVPDAALYARVLADGAREQRRRVATSPGPLGWIRGLMRDVGGWPAMAGLASATVAGIWLGVSPPAPLSVVAQSYFGSRAVDGVDAVEPVFDAMVTDDFGSWGGTL